MTEEPVSLEEPCGICEQNAWYRYEPTDGVADVWFECATEGCSGVRFAPAPSPAAGSDDGPAAVEEVDGE